MTIGENLRQLRLKNNLTQPQLAELTGLSIPTIKKYEKGTRKPKFEQMVRIVTAFDLSPCSFCEYYKEVQ